MLSILVFSCGLAKAQSNREDIEIQWPKTDGWELDKILSTQTDFSHRRQKWNLKQDKKESWQKMVMILNDDITKNTKPQDSLNILPDLSTDKGIRFKLLAENKNTPFPYKLISMENRTLKLEQTPISTLVYIKDGKTCRHLVLVSMRTSEFPADFLKEWSEILLNSQIISSKEGNFEYTDDAYLDIKETNGVDSFYINANFTSNQLQHLLKGQSAKIVIDNFPELTLSGKVLEINSKIKSEFALTSPNTNTGNFVKMVERFLVIIKVEIPSGVREKLKNSMSCTVTVATK
ncbi:hypothetical protein [Pedobacter cryoconitis]|uniref:HlyD family secretion protein n=1 Tax=Pedobacter cryoconitis TaxID=188932 RepID=A0A7X0J068_9SPHI|nr:hypothetical protein [Pedobacter cryoconitis]MBB6498495.1 hypothetical protein [Pedobacter cryoconitis]